MKEVTLIALVSIVILSAGIAGIFFSSDFSFNKSTLIIDGNRITETLEYTPDKNYHTLYRSFVDPLKIDNRSLNTIAIKRINCSAGQAYAKIDNLCFSGDLSRISCNAYTEDNEYGCTFGNTYGFFPSNSYNISSTYELNPENLFSINGQNYIKFVVHSPGEHNLLKSNFQVSSQSKTVKKEIYLPNENVIVYIPYSENIERNVIYLKDFEFDSSILNSLSYAIFILPAFLIFFIWLFFGKDPHTEMPNQLSMIPDEKNKRKPWQISAFFNPPFATVDNNLFAATMLSLYHQKIIDVKMEKKMFGEKMTIKLNKGEEGLDNIEKQVYEILKELEKEPGQFFSLEAGFIDSFKIKSKAKLLEKSIKKESKEFVSTTGAKILEAIFPILIFLSFFAFQNFLGKKASVIFMFISIFSAFTIITLAKTTSVFTKHKKEYFREYLHWQAFKKYLKNSFSIREGTHKTLIMWEDYLIYATALGVPKKVIKELEANQIITPAQATMYTGIYIHSAAFSSASVSSGGGHSGAGGGGVGGGGGGGR